MKKQKNKEVEQPRRVFKNPLMQTLGMVLQNMRNMLVQSSDEVAARLGLGGSSYRMVEAGSAVLQPGKAVQVIRTFERIEFEPLCRILVALQVMESGVDSIDDMRAMSKLLAEADPSLIDLMNLYEPVWPLIKSQESGVIADEIRARKIDDALERFLTTRPQLVQDADGLLDHHVRSLLSSTPPFYLDLSLDLLENLQGYVPRVSPQELSKWEIKNRSRIVEIIGLLRDSRSLTVSENFEFFDHPFLWEPQFEKMRIVHMNTSKKDVFEEFRGNLHGHLQRYSKKYELQLLRFDGAMEKITFRAGARKKDEAEELFTHESMTMNNLWFYKLRGGNVVAFADNSELNAPEELVHYGTSFTYGETISKLKAIETLWDSLHD
ncbi:MAG: hypothetical protein KDC45_04610 [Bacteroidetes bacterium]|nr:hypothetical protein [Bacteroidota bacterium]